MENITIGIIGCGNMGGAILRGIVDNDIISRDRIFLYDKDIHKAQTLADETETHLKDVKTAVVSSDIIVIGVKPQDSAFLLKEIAPFLNGDKTIISIMAGVKIDTITETLGMQLSVVRAMPNMAAFVSESMTCVSFNELVKHKEIAKEIFSGIGKVQEVSEEDMDAVTAVSGSGPAYLFYLAEALTEAGVKAGLNVEASKELAEQTLLGASLLLNSVDDEASDLVKKVASKGGTTEAALSVFEAEGLKEIVNKAVLAAKKRSQELSKG